MKVLKSLVISALFVLALSATTYGQVGCSCVSDGGLVPDGGGQTVESTVSYSYEVGAISFEASGYAYADAWANEFGDYVEVSGAYDHDQRYGGGTLQYSSNLSYGCVADVRGLAYATSWISLSW